MKKREFLAVGGAVPLMLAGCGGNSGSAPVRLLNASVGYPELGFMDESTQVSTADVAYGDLSPFYGAEAGSVDITLTVGGQSATSASAKALSKDSRYTLVAYGFADELKSVLITESTVTPDTGKANINVLNTSVDIGAVDVYLSQTTDLAVSTQIASSTSGVTSSALTGIIAGAYYITVVGANSIAKGISDVRFVSPTPITLTALQIYTIVLTPGASGVLANAIFFQQGTAATTATSFLNTTARLRAVTSVGTATTSVVGTSGTTAVTILGASASAQYSNYFVINTGAAPTVTVNGATVPTTATLAAGGDYTLAVYLDSNGQPVTSLILDNNTAPVTSTGVKFRLINLASNNQGLSLSMSVNSISVASNIAYATASAYTEISTPQATNSVAEVFNGALLLASHTQVMQLPQIFTDIVLSVDPVTGAVADFFRSASGT